MITVKARLFLASISVMMGVILLWATGLIPQWGVWYSSNLHFRAQTEALLKGHFAIATSPAPISLDLAWAAGGVQQVWGLGVAIWRLPWELLAKLFGQRSFPDRLAFGAAVALVCLLVVHTFVVEPAQKRTFKPGAVELWHNLDRLAIALVIVLFPPFITVCRGPFDVYEEAVAYGYLYGVGLFVGLLAFGQNPTVRRFFLLSICSGLAGFVRPTIMAYGLAAFVSSSLISRRLAWTWPVQLSGLACFVVGVALLLATNLSRFGSAFEWGHKLNCSSTDIMYASRFDAPYHDAPPIPASMELLGSLFFLERLNGFDFYSPGVVRWQSSTPRWRFFYHPTFDASYLIAGLLFFSGTSWVLYRLFKRIPPERDAPRILIAASWCILSLPPLIFFYLRFHAISSRYLIDFAPAIAVFLVGAIITLRGLYSRTRISGPAVGLILLCGLSLWWGCEVYSAEQARRVMRYLYPQLKRAPVRQDAVLRGLLQYEKRHRELPTEYSAGTNIAKATGIPRNGYGWILSAQAKPVVVLFFSNISKLVLEVAPASEQLVSEQDYTCIRAKVGLEFLELLSSKSTAKGRQLVFSAPRKPINRRGIQVAFLSFAAPGQFAAKDSSFRLLRVASDGP